MSRFREKDLIVKNRQIARVRVRSFYVSYKDSKQTKCVFFSFQRRENCFCVFFLFHWTQSPPKIGYTLKRKQLQLFFKRRSPFGWESKVKIGRVAPHKVSICPKPSKRQTKLAADDILIYYFSLSKKIRLDFSSEST